MCTNSPWGMKLMTLVFQVSHSLFLSVVFQVNLSHSLFFQRGVWYFNNCRQANDLKSYLFHHIAIQNLIQLPIRV
jgi:hypothetical protein